MCAIKLAHGFAALHLQQDRRKKLTANCSEAVERLFDRRLPTAI
jgi:hypothetical protein